jgi:hypothetical protein
LPDKLLEALLSYAKKTITHMNTDRESLVRNREEHEGIVGIKKRIDEIILFVFNTRYR